MEEFYPHQEDAGFILEQIRAPEEVKKYPLPPSIIKILDEVRAKLPD